MLFKLWRVRGVLDGAVKMKVTVISLAATIGKVAMFLLVDYIILTIWTVHDRLKWQRSCTSYGEGGVCLSSQGRCTGTDSAWIFVTPLAILHFGALFYAAWECYHIRKIPDELGEGRWITTIISSSIQIHIICLPLAILVSDNASSLFLLLSILIFINDAIILACMFIPKMWALNQPQRSSQQKNTDQVLANIRDDIVNAGRRSRGGSVAMTMESKDQPLRDSVPSDGTGSKRSGRAPRKSVASAKSIGEILSSDPPPIPPRKASRRRGSTPTQKYGD